MSDLTASLGTDEASAQRLANLYADPAAGSPPWDPATREYPRSAARALTRGVLARRRVEPPAAHEPPAIATPQPAAPADATPASVKAGAVLRVLRGEPLDAVARALDVAPATLATWRDAFLAGAVARLAGG
jgi:hypothetical protein